MKIQNRLLILCLAMSSMTFAQDHKILTIGHRGAMGHITENTVASVQKAIDMQCDMIEIDVYKVKDGSMMVFHDNTIDRVTDGKGKIEDYTKAELQQLTVVGGHTIPTLEDIIAVIDKKAVLNIELKGANTAEDTYKTIQLFKQQGWTNDDFIISSFKWDELEKMRALDKSIAIAVLTDKSIDKAIVMAKQINAVAINPSYKLLNEETTQQIKRESLKIYPWTVNDPKDIKRLKELQVDGIITNFPERI